MYILLKKGNTCNNKVFKEDYMKKDIHLKHIGEKHINDKIISYVVMGAIVVAIIIISLLLYSQKINQDVKDETMTLDQMTDMIGDTNEYNNETESASTEIGKTVEESKEEVKPENVVTNETTQNISSNESVESSSVSTNTTQNTTSEDEQEPKETKELSFQRPVEGEIVREFAQENLVYSETLEEWVTHNGIDIKADKTTVVKAAEAGVVKSIKNDPRYGLTIVIEHDDTYQTVYSNLLTSEFVVEGESVEKGQSIGTVGNSAVFEIADEPHLHFEILKDSIAIDPSIYIQ